MKIFEWLGLMLERAILGSVLGRPILLAIALMAAGGSHLVAGPIHTGRVHVPNASFESPATDFADPRMDDWQKAPEPAWYQGGNGFPWEQLVGQFLNTPTGSSNHIDNVEGNQGAFIFALPDVAILQDYNTLSRTNAGLSPQLNAVFEAGKSYALTAAVLGGGGGMSNGATFEISLYYRDANSNMVVVAATTITNTPDLFPTNTHFLDFQARTPIVKTSDPWFGKQIGIRLASTVGFNLQGGYWDVDNIRLTENLVPNNSFESPRTDFADPRMDGWQKAPEPAWYQGGNGFPWDQLVGQFFNTPRGNSNHIDNVEGKQAAFLFALPDVAIFQDYNSLAGTNAIPNHDFNVRFEIGKSYALTAAVLGGGGGMSNGATFEISLYYRDTNSNMVTVAAATITNSAALFPTNTHFFDLQARTPIVQETNAWAGQNIGVRLASTVGFGLQGGYWDVDNVRVTESVVPNASFEAPDTDFADPRMDDWQKAPEPVWYQGGGGFPWDQLIGQFINTPRGSSNHIDNLDGEQAAFIFALPDVAIFQEFSSLTRTNGAFMPDFSGKFEIGKAYALTVGVLGGGGGMSNGATFEISFYYRDAESNRVTIAATSITNSAALFPTTTHFTDFRVVVPSVNPETAWAGKPIGIRLASTTGFDRQGGYWDIDDVQLELIQSPVLVDSLITNGRFQFTLESSQGRFEILGNTNVAPAASGWTNLGTITNTTGRASFVDTNSNVGHRFYQVRQAP